MRNFTKIFMVILAILPVVPLILGYGFVRAGGEAADYYMTPALDFAADGKITADSDTVYQRFIDSLNVDGGGAMPVTRQLLEVMHSNAGIPITAELVLVVWYLWYAFALGFAQCLVDLICIVPNLCERMFRR